MHKSQTCLEVWYFTTPTCFGMSVTTSGSLCAKFKTYRCVIFCEVYVGGHCTEYNTRTRTIKDRRYTVCLYKQTNAALIW